MSRFAKSEDPLVLTVDSQLQLDWSHNLLDGKNCTHPEAEAACKALGDGWRLPTDLELVSLIDRTKYAPACNDEVREAFPDIKHDWYWTSVIHAADSDFAWFVYFGFGDVNDYCRGGGYACVRAVRASSPRQ